MKKLQIILAAVILLLVFSCNNKEEKQKPNSQESLIQGEILHPKDYPIIIRQGAKIDSITPDTNQNFSFTLQIDAPQYIQFKYRRKSFPLYVYPGDSIQLSYDDENTKTPFEFSKGNTAPSLYLTEMTLFQQNSPTFSDLLYEMDIDSFLIKSEITKNEMSDLLDLWSETITDDDFIEKESKRINFLFYNLNFRYKDYFTYFSEDTLALDSVNFFDFADNLDINDEDALGFDSYPTAIINYINYQMEEEKIESYETMVQEQIELVQKEITNQAVKEAVLYQIIIDYGRYNGFEAIEQAYQEFINQAADEYRIENLKRLYQRWDKIKQGENAPEFSYPDIKGDSISLADFRGQILYIDVWATWCGPCRVEIPAFTELVNEYSNEPVQFLSVSVDENKTAWIKFIEEEAPDWPQTFTGGWDCSICEDYFIKGIPRFILIDAEGKIIDATAPRPSSDEIRPLLDELIQELS
ncbi:MAG: TlpA disulfide reductase family protein [Bacteroidales bacterium]|jgi:thiol-disulfide isomerase/thioredoxin|nr:TlpA disulfide reductase family protein [Bacteroidales bacterium]